MASTMMSRYASTGLVSALALFASSSAWAEAFEHRALENVALNRPSDVRTTLLQQQVPAGTWLITAKASLENAGDADYFTCELQANGQSIDASVTTIGSASGLPLAATLYNQRILSIVEPTQVALVCWHAAFLAAASAEDPSSPPAPFADKGASLIISRVGEAPPSLACKALPLVDAVTGAPLNPCLPGHQFVEDPQGLNERASPVDWLCVEPPPRRPLPRGPAGIAVGLDRTPSVAPPDACLAQPSLQVRDTWLFDEDQGPLYNTCPEDARYLWCTDYDYCWCSANPG